MIIGWIIVGIFIILSVVLISGRGSWLIAGYNTASEEEKEKYDEKKLCRAVGVMLLLIALATAGLLIIPYTSALSTNYFTFFFIFIIAAVIITAYYTNKKCLKKEKTVFDFNSPYSEINHNTKYNYGKPAKKGKNITGIIAACMLLLPVVLLVSIELSASSNPPVFTINDGVLNISTTYGEDVNLSDIKNIELKNTMPDNLSKKSGTNMGSILKGQFKTDGNVVDVYVDASKPPFIYISTTDGLLIINDQTKLKTQALYNQLKSDIGQ